MGSQKRDMLNGREELNQSKKRDNVNGFSKKGSSLISSQKKRWVPKKKGGVECPSTQAVSRRLSRLESWLVGELGDRHKYVE